MLAALITQHPMPLGAFAEVPPELDRIIQRTLARTPEQRYASVDDLAAELEKRLPSARRQRNAGATAPLVDDAHDDDTVVVVHMPGPATSPSKFPAVATLPGISAPKQKP